MSKTKIKTTFFCKNCGAEYPQWMGKCKACGQWNTITEEKIVADKRLSWTKETQGSKPVLIQSVEFRNENRINLKDNELNRVLGGGLVPGSLILVGGEPGIGKSTLLLQVMLKLEATKVLYVSGEESETQIKMRADRIGIENQEVFVLNETSTKAIFGQIEIVNPSIVIIDSIQTLQTEIIDSSAGTITQIRECAGELQRFAKESGVPVFIIGHITKDGSIAGPKILEHMVDTVLQFEGDRHHGYRLLRSLKNRFGSTAELGIYEMENSGMREVSNPSEILLMQRDQPVSGIAIAATMEGGRPMLIEVQALASSAVYGTPQRSATGYDFRRLNMLLAIIEKRAGFKLGAKDVFLNMAGGIRVDDPAIDLAVIAAVLSSNYDMPIDEKTCFAAEVGLAGEIRSVNFVEQRIAEAEKLGFQRIIVSRYNLKGLQTENRKINIMSFSKIEDVVKNIFK
ncbi:MAG: DNA repair protein RadA [Bacteroidales bacterium]|nr:DNA repair protein RadA [Bacteroidales bacterium]